MKPILEVKGISKKFILHHREAYLNLRERVSNLFTPSESAEEFWALQEISFDVAQGESIAIIGHNGAGKSTLLKILSRITPPTAGSITCRGRIASLLEVGTGFHPELTGRENIYLNGSILGMKKREISNKFDEIVDFAGTEKFLDTPLKHYSSGMQLRLAFSIAAFLEPEILVIDEVLAVGDAEFQKKCMGKMEDVSRSGRTILFVSHNMIAVQSLCERTVLLSNGRIGGIGPSHEMINTYLNKQGASEALELTDFANQKRKGNGAITFKSIQLNTDNASVICPGGKISFKMGMMNHKAQHGDAIYLALTIYDQQRVKLLTLDNLYTEQPVSSESGVFWVSCEVPLLSLLPGTYYFDLWCANHFETFDMLESAGRFVIEESDMHKTGKAQNVQQHGYYWVPNFWKNANDGASR